MSEAQTIHFPVFARIPKIDPITKHPIAEPEPEVRDTSKYQYVVIPEMDMFGKPFAGVSINGVKFERGRTYFVAPEFADEVRKLLVTGQKADLRIMQSQPDVKSVSEQSQHGSSANGSTFVRS